MPESPRESMEMAAMFDEMVKDIPAGDLDAHGSKVIEKTTTRKKPVHSVPPACNAGGLCPSRRQFL